MKMAPQKSIKQLLEEKCNDYSSIEPFNDPSPIPSSIVIPVYNHRNIFANTLRNISSQLEITKNPDNFEIIIVNDGSTENIDSTMANINFPCDLNYISYRKNQGRSYARNQGIQKASKNLIFFFDADILLPPSYFENVWKIHNSSENILAVGLAENIYSGDNRLKDIMKRYIQPDLTDDFRYQKDFPKGKFNRENYKLIHETDWFKKFGKGKKIGPWTLSKMAVAHNMITRRAHIENVRGFDERFKTWGYEDTLFGAKLIARGCYLIPLKNTGVIRILNGKKKKDFRDDNETLYEQIIQNEIV